MYDEWDEIRVDELEKERNVTKEEMIKNLNEDLAGELSAITYAAKATGP